MRGLVRRLRGIVAVLILIALLVLYAWSEEIGIGVRDLVAGSERVDVRDGDTFLMGKTKVRISGIDAPELHQNCTDAAGKQWPCGKEALKTLEHLLRAPDLACTPRAIDRFGRSISECRNARIADVGAEMVRLGFAVSRNDRGEAPYADAEDEARAAKRGMWQGRFELPRNWRDAHPQTGRD